MRLRYVCIPLATVCLGVAMAADVVVTEELVAKVNGEIITSGELDAARVEIEADLKKKGMSGATLQQAVNDQMSVQLGTRIDTLLLTQKAKDLNIKVDQDVNREIANWMRRTNTTDPDEFQRLVVKETGKPYEDFRANIQDGLLVQRVVGEEVMRKINLTSEETRAYYDAHKTEFQRDERVFLREIFIQTDAKKTPEELAAAEAKAKDLSARGNRGETFSKMALDNSDAVTKEQGGLLEPATKGVLNSDLEVLVWDKPAGFVTDPIKLPNGWLILKVEDHHRAGLAAYEEVQTDIENKMSDARREPMLRAYLTKLRQEAFLQVKPAYLEAYAAPGKDTRWGDVATLRPETVTRAEVISNPSMKRLLGMFPIPGTQKTGASSSR